MSASDRGWEFPLAQDPEEVRAPRAEDERLDDPKYRPEMFFYEKDREVELRCAAGFIKTGDYAQLSQWR